MQNDLTFFTNEPGSALLDRFKRTLRDVKFFDILVGYFRTSGFDKLHESFATIDKIRILVGLNVDWKAFEIIDACQSQSMLDFQSHKRTKEIFSEEVTAEIDRSPDRFEMELGVRKFIEFLRSGKMEIKAYPSGNLHAKVYISRFGEDDRDFGRVITGSSNFSEAGLKMAESQSHKQAKKKAPGESEVKIPGKRRLDSATSKTATEIERNVPNIPKAVERLKDSGRPRKVLQVPQHLMTDAVKEMKKQGVPGTVKNLSSTKRRSIPKKS